MSLSLKRDRDEPNNAVHDLQPSAKRQKISSLNEQKYSHPNSLPIDRCKDEILALINDPSNDIVIITGDTGSGKSTQLSQILFKSGLYEKIIITQPRRIGAVSLARRVSKEMNTKLGETVGYSIRFQDKSSMDTNIKYVTDGILLRELTMNKSTNIKYDVIILDEAHERSLQTDILFAILRDIIKQSNSEKPPFKLLITSATLNVDKFSSFFMDCPVYHIEGRCFDVETFHCTQQQSNYIQACIETALQIHVNEMDTNADGELGHILCFLTGQNEIERACKLMGEAMDELIASSSLSDEHSGQIADCVILRAYGNLAYELQQNIFAKVPTNCRKIIFCTNIAETSLTVNGISYVIDPGLVKQKRYNADTRMDELIINNISKISAIQRKGRAGRTRKGQCYRLYTKQEMSEFEEETVPEIMRSNLCSTILILKSMGIDNIHRFEYLDKPNNTAFVNALHKLYLLNAIDANGQLNEHLAYQMMKFPLDPIYSNILIQSIAYKAMDIALSLVAIISANNGNSADIFLRPQHNENEHEKLKYVQMHKQFDSKYGDIISWLLVFNNFDKMQCDETGYYEWAKRHFVNLRILKTAKKIREQLEEIVKNEFDQNVIFKQASKPIKAIRKVLAKSLFFQSALKMDLHRYNDDGKKKKNEHMNQRKIVFKVYGNNEYDGNVYIHPSSMSNIESADIEWIVYLDILYTSKPFMRGICAIKYEWIKKLLPKMKDSFSWMNGEEEKKGNVVEDKESVVVLTEEEVQKMKEIAIEKTKQKQIRVDSARERYLKRKMLKNK